MFQNFLSVSQSHRWIGCRPYCRKSQDGLSKALQGIYEWIPARIAVFKERNFMPATMAAKKTMKAVQIHAFGGPEVLRYEDVPLPKPKPNEILVRVRAAGVNPVDWKIREGHLSGSLPMIMGVDFSAVVESVGSGVTKFRPGDAVFGQVADESGSYAEYALTMESYLARKPEGLDDIRAAALPVAGLVAWQALFDTAKLTSGQTALIHGASGGVGRFAVQFAKCKGARVIGTASGDHVGQVRQLGADEVIDYRKTKFEEVAREVDVVLDTVGGETQERSWKVLKRGGVLVSLVQPPSAEKAAAQGARGFIVYQKGNGEQLATIADLVTKGKVKVNVETVLPLQEARKAQEMSQSGHAGGKIVLEVNGP
jgi:NADPH:quinone reductase-like Zn-dependent oxidoreductase